MEELLWNKQNLEMSNKANKGLLGAKTLQEKVKMEPKNVVIDIYSKMVTNHCLI